MLLVEQSNCCSKVWGVALGNCCPCPSASGNNFPELHLILRDN